MKVKLLKTGKIAMHPARGPVLDCVEGQVVEVNENYAIVLLEHRWATIPQDEIENCDRGVDLTAICEDTKCTKTTETTKKTPQSVKTNKSNSKGKNASTYNAKKHKK